jgi:hypothetical protein
VREGDEGTCATISEWPEHEATCSTRTPDRLTRASKKKERITNDEQRTHFEPKQFFHINELMLPASSAIGVGVLLWKFGIE